MKDMFESIRPDKTFNLEKLTYQEIFDGLKSGIATAISKITKQKVCVDDLKLNEDRCYTKRIFAKDMNLYPKIYLDMIGEFSVLINPFEIDILKIEYKIDSFSCDELRECLYDFMCKKFPKSNYEKAFEKYFNMSELVQRKREEMLFL